MPIFSLAGCVLALAARQDWRGELDVRPSAMTISPAGDVWLGTRDGRAFVSRDDNRSWSEIELGPRAERSVATSEGVTQIRFFDVQHALLTGASAVEAGDELLRTTDGGRTWTRVSLGMLRGARVNFFDAQVSPDGRAWLATSVGVVVSTDFGASWHGTAAPFEGAAASCRPLAFRTSELGLVGAEGNALNLTRDGGRTWTGLPTPLDDLHPDELRAPARDSIERDDPFAAVEEQERAVEARRIRGVWCLGERWIVLQHRNLSERPIEGSGHWRAIELGGREVIAAAPDAQRLLIVTNDLHVWWLSSTLELSAACERPLENGPFLLAAGARGAAFLISDRRLCTLAEGELACSMLFPSKDAPSSWPIDAFDRTTSGTLFGVSENALYRSHDAGRRWERLAQGQFLRDVFAADDGGHVLVLGHRATWLWRGGNELEPVLLDDEPMRDITVHARDGRRWLATYAEVAQDRRTQRMLLTTDTVFVGPGFGAIVLSSINAGRTWTRIAERQGSVADAAWLGDGGRVWLRFSDGALASGALVP